MKKRGFVNTEKFQRFPYEFVFNPNEQGQDMVQLCLPLSFVRMLQSNVDRYSWWSSYRNADGEIEELSIEQKDIIEKGLIHLIFMINDCNATLPDNCQDVIVKYVRECSHKGVFPMCCCCGCNGQEDIVGPEVEEEIQEEIEEDIPPPVTDEEMIEKCKRAYAMTFSYMTTLAWIAATFTGNISPTAAIVAQYLASKKIFSVIAGRLAWFVTILNAISPRSGDELEEMAHDSELFDMLKCILYNAENGVQARSRFINAIITYTAGMTLVTRLISWGLAQTIIFSLLFSSLFLGQYIAPESDCSCGSAGYPVPEPEPGGEGDDEPIELPETGGYYLVPIMSISEETRAGGTSGAWYGGDNFWRYDTQGGKYLKWWRHHPIPHVAFADDDDRVALVVKFVSQENLANAAMSTWLTSGSVMHPERQIFNSSSPVSEVWVFGIGSDYALYGSALELLIGDHEFVDVGTSTAHRHLLQVGTNRDGEVEYTTLLLQLWEVRK